MMYVEVALVRNYFEFQHTVSHILGIEVDAINNRAEIKVDDNLTATFVCRKKFFTCKYAAICSNILHASLHFGKW